MSLIPTGLGNATGRATQAIQLLSLGLSFPSVNTKKYVGVCSGGGGRTERAPRGILEGEGVKD